MDVTIETTLVQQKRVMVEALRRELGKQAMNGHKLTIASYRALNGFEHSADEWSLRLIFEMVNEFGNEPQRSVIVSLVARGGESYVWRVKEENSCWASKPEATMEALRGWVACKELARAALECADQMPTIMARVEQTEGES